MAGPTWAKEPRGGAVGTVFLLVLSSAVSAAAQSPPSVAPRVELGAGAMLMGGLYWCVDFSDFVGDLRTGLAGVELAMRVTVASRLALEGRVVFSEVDRVSETWYEFGAVPRTQPPTPHWIELLR